MESKYTLSNFTGPIDLLFFLIQKEELDIFEIPLSELTKQHFSKTHDLNDGADFLFFVSFLLLLKSKHLLNPKAKENESFEISPELFQQLLEYERFREIASLLEKREEKEMNHFFRDIEPTIEKRSENFLTVDLKELTSLFTQLMAKKEKEGTLKIVEEKWLVSIKIEELTSLLTLNKKLFFREIFKEEKSKEELIVLFLALLEIIRQKKARFVTENQMIELTS